MKKVAIMMGSESDRAVVNTSLEYYEFFGIPVEILVMSAHRTPEQVQHFAKNAQNDGFGVIVACAGMAAHLPGVVAAYTTLPVIGVPLAPGHLNGLDALYSIVQMPAGVPVATMAIGKAGVRNAAVFAAEILALMTDGKIAEKLLEFKKRGCKITV
jgi:5-(carboxyamino)imidazole ribonucleotide mutase